MKVRIIKASKPTYWYAGRIGETFEIRDKRGIDGDYVVVGDDYRGIKKSDCEVVEQ
jgi:hypothetical protein